MKSVQNVDIKSQGPLRVAQIMGKHTAGGIKSVIMNYYKGIDKSKIQFDFFVDDNSPNKDYRAILKEGGRVFEIPSVSKHPVKHVKALSAILKKEHIRIVHGYLNTLNPFSMLAAKLAGCPVRIAENLSTAHSGERKTLIKNILKPFGRWFATNLAANSVFSGIWLYGEKSFQKGEIQIFRNGIDLDAFHYDPHLRAATRKQYNLEGKFVVGHIGRYQYQKNHNFLIDIFREIHLQDETACLMLIGYGDLKSAVFEKIQHLDLEDCVLDLGGREDIVQFYNAMDCFVLPSLYEGLPVVGIEAQATGLPCVFSSEVTHETQITSNVDYIDLDTPAKVWAETILKWKMHQRAVSQDQIIIAGYDIKTEAHTLETYYLQNYSRYVK